MNASTNRRMGSSGISQSIRWDFPSLHTARLANSDDAGLLFDVDAKHRLFPVKTDEHSQDHNLVRSRLSLAATDTGTRVGVSSVHAEN